MDSFYPAIDGVVLVVDNLAKALSKFNDVTVVVPYNESYIEDSKRPYKVIRVNSVHIPKTEYRLGNFQPKISKTFHELVSEKFDIIHIHSPFTIGKLGLRVARKLHVPCIATMHTRFDFELRKYISSKKIVQKIIDLYIKVYNKCDKCIAVNHAMIDVFKDYGYKYEPVVIYNGTDLKPLKEKDKEKNIERVNELYKLDKDETVLLFVGRITEIKNIFFILDSLKLLKEDGYKFKMIYVGTGPDLKELKAKVKEYKMQDSVIFAGKIEDRDLLSAIYLRAKLFLFPSVFDASSLVQIEAAVNETPGLFIENSVTADTVLNDVSGFTSKYDIESYKERIKEILANEGLLKEVSKNAKNMLGNSWDTIANDTYNLYLDEISRLKKESGKVDRFRRKQTSNV